LRDEHLHCGEAQLIARDNDRPLQDVLAESAGDGTTLLVIEDPAEPSLRGLWSTPLLEYHGGADVVLGWLRLEAQELHAYANRAVAMLRRPAQPAQTVALLGPREQRYVDLLDQLVIAAESTRELVPFNWGAERLARHHLARALRQGAGAAIYTGHGSAGGWFAYGGVSADALADGPMPADDESIGVVFSLACRTGQTSRVTGAGAMSQRRGLADEISRCGIAGAVLAPVGDSLHEDNRVLAATLIRALGSGMRTCADIVRASHADGACLDGYVIVGDPAMPVAGAPGARERCATIFAPARDAGLTRA